MKKLLIVLMIVAMASFLFVGCLPTTTPSNEAPIITSDPITTATVGVLYTYDVEATDPDGDKLTYSLTVMPSGMIITPATGLIVWTPPAEGDYDVTVKVSDGDLDITQPFVITVSELGLYLAGIVVDPEEMDLVVGETEKIVSVTATYEVKGYGVDIDLEDCLFLTSDEDVATVKGELVLVEEEELYVVTVTAEGVGTTDILVEYEGKFATLAVTVIAVELDHITVNPKTMNLIVGGADQELSKTIGSVVAYYNNEDFVGVNLVDCEYLFNKEVVTVDDNGLVTVAGDLTEPKILESIIVETTITVNYTKEGITKTANVDVTVTVISNDIRLESLTVNVDGEDIVVILESGLFVYEVDVPGGATVIVVEAEPTHPKATAEVTSGAILPPAVAATIAVIVTVTAEDGSGQDYTLNITGITVV
ncbi:hypothetical protein ES705_34856 [subsurface metagenome]